MGKWLRVERHIFYSMVRDETACYEKEGERWRKYGYDNKTKQFIYKGEQKVDISACHQIHGKVDGVNLYKHIMYNMMSEMKEGIQ